MTTEPAKARTEPVKDWATDYDIFDAGYVKDPFPVWDELREKCPVAHTERWGGSWMPTTYEDLRKIAANVEIFSSRNPLVANDGEPTEEVGAELEEQFSVGAPPISSDPPIHTWSRALLLPKFSIKEVARYEEETRELCRSLIDGFVDKGRADAAADYAQQIPSRVIASMLGIPQARAGDFTDWVRGFLEYGLPNVDLRSGAAMIWS